MRDIFASEQPKNQALRTRVINQGGRHLPGQYQLRIVSFFIYSYKDKKVSLK